MKIDDPAFSANVELPCKIFCGPESLLEFSGIAVNIGTGSLRLDLGVLTVSWQPMVGESLRLEILLPVRSPQAGVRCLSARARVAQVEERPDGSRLLELRFRKPVFKKDAGSATATQVRSAGEQWHM
jgi:hypothetical protein